MRGEFPFALYKKQGLETQTTKVEGYLIYRSKHAWLRHVRTAVRLVADAPVHGWLWHNPG